MGSLGTFFQQLFGPVGAIFHVVFYLPIYNVLMLLYEGVHALSPVLPAYAIAIFFLTVIIRLCLFPLTRKQLQSSRKMQEVAPQLEELKRRHRGNPQELMAAQQALYKENGVSMYGGCLPLLIQMPFLYGLYFSLYTALLTSSKTETVAHHLLRVNGDIYPFLPHLTALPNTLFLWTNLASPDPLKILPVLAGLLTFLQLRMAMPVRAKAAPGTKSTDPNSQAMGTMQFVMPFITFFMALNFPSGLAFYWTISTAFSAAQQYFLTGFGSLFVGIPGMEHLVPEPKALATSSSIRTQSALVDSSVRSDRPTGIAGLRQLLSEMAASRAQQPSTDNSAPANGATGNGSTGRSPKKDADRAASDAARNGNGAAPVNGMGDVRTTSAPKGTNGDADGAARRNNRAGRQGPTLVRPSASSGPVGPGAEGGLPSANGASGNGNNGHKPAPGSSNGNGTVGPASGLTNRGPSSAGAQPPRPPTGQNRGGSGGGAGGASRKRPPNGKSKGGR